MEEELLLFNSDYARVSINKTTKTGILSWKRQATKDEFWEASYFLMQYIGLGNIENCLFIQDYSLKIPKEHKLWLRYLALPDAKTAGLRRIATFTNAWSIFLFFENVAIRFFSENIIPHKKFSDLHKMQEWLWGRAVS